jgi:hypothetical protein
MDKLHNQSPSSNRGRGRRTSDAGHARGPRSWSPLVASSTYDSEEDYYWLEREMSLLEEALADKGEMRRGELGDLVGCKYWGPGRFARALKKAASEGRIRRLGVGRYGPAS